MGNPHAVLLVDDVDTAPVATLGPVIEGHVRFPRRVNAGFPAGDGAFEVQLYRVTVGVERPQGRAPAPLVFDRLGWRRLEMEG